MCKVTPSGNQYATIYVDEHDKVRGQKNTILKKCYNKYISSDPISIITNELPSINSSSFSLKN